MVEFQEVMKQAKRMCVTVNDCDQCELMTDAGCRFAIFADDAKYSHEIERIVMDWAATNPEPVYPTWTEWLRTFSAKGVDLYEPIPADIAEKLGIKPVGGDEG